MNADGTILEVRAGRLAETPFISQVHLGRRVQDLLPRRGVGEALSGALQEVVRTNTPAAPLEFSRTKVGGEVRHYEARVMPLRELHLMVIIREITERKLAEEELHRHREHLEELVAERTAELERTNKQLEQLLYYIEMTERKAAENWLDSPVELDSPPGWTSPERRGSRPTPPGRSSSWIWRPNASPATRGTNWPGKPVWSLFTGGDLRELLSREVLEQGRSAEYALIVSLVRKDGSKEAVRVSGDPIADAPAP
ncbi:PAS domain-containing protein [Methanoculleus chikugoensis]|uniref:PAS domain-containing protein n=1 Tax=Methanoculleus chikugoensis TaxID=118126 RepID=UPI0006D1F17F|nr:PAS domain-containing protein [Methanoculleus chikugoensis]